MAKDTVVIYGRHPGWAATVSLHAPIPPTVNPFIQHNAGLVRDLLKAGAPVDSLNGLNPRNKLFFAL